MNRFLDWRRSAWIICAAALAAAPVTYGDWVFNGQDGTNWFDGTNWYDTFGDGPGVPPSTGTLPDDTQTTNINIGTPADTSPGSTGGTAIFDPANQIGDSSDLITLSRTYISSNDAGPGSSSDVNFTGTATGSNTLEIDSGTMYVENNYIIAGRVATGTILQNGGALNIDQILELGNTNSGLTGTGIYDYHGGTLQAGWQGTALSDYPGGGANDSGGLNPGTSPGVRLGVGSGSSGTFVDYNDGASGAIEVAGFFVSYDSTSTGTVEFHYDNGGVRPIQIGVNPNSAATNGTNSSGELSIRNSSTQTSFLNLVLDSNPTMTLVNGTEVPQNLGLFSTTSSSEIVYSSGGTKGFYDSANPANALLEGDAITRRAPNGYFDTWDISYQGTINFSDVDANGFSEDSAISSVTGPNNLLGDSTTGGGSVVLIGVSAIAPVTGDATGDGKVNIDDYDVLEANLGKDVTGGYADADFNDDGVVNADDVSIFQLGLAEYNASNPPAVPEPAALSVLAALPLLGSRRRRGQ